MIHQVLKSGKLTAPELLAIDAKIKSEVANMEVKVKQESLRNMLWYACNVLAADFWTTKKSRKRMAQFLIDMVNLFDSHQKGFVTDKELNDLCLDVMGLDVQKQWEGWMAKHD